MRPETHLGPVTLYHRFFFLADRGGIRFAAFLDRGERLTFNTRCIESRRLQRESVCGGSRTRGLAIDPSRVNRVDHPWRDVHLLPSLSSSLPPLFLLENARHRYVNRSELCRGAIDGPTRVNFHREIRSKLKFLPIE